MRASKSMMLWLFLALAVPASCLLKGTVNDAVNARFIETLAASRAQLDTRMNPADGPRILLAGGSNAVSSFDSDAISRRTGLPVYNLGVLGEGLDVQNLFDVVEARARPGDHVVISALSLLSHRESTPESDRVTFASGTWRVPSHRISLPTPLGTLNLSVMQLFDNVTLVRSLSNYRQWQSMSSPIDVLATAGSQQDHSVRLAGNRSVIVNHQGDWIDCTTSTNAKPLDFDPKLLARSRDFHAMATAFAARMAERGVKAQFMLPTVLIRERDRSRWEAQIGDLKQELHMLSFIDNDREWQLKSDSTQFCDTNAHLLRTHAVRNSEPIIDAINGDHALVSR